MKYVKKVIKTSGGLVVRVPSDIVKVLGLTDKDYVEIDLNIINVKELKKKSQVTTFMILSVLILLIGVIYFSYLKSAEKEPEVVQPEVMPIKEYVENCMKLIAEDGLERIGLSGGYISIPQKISGNPRSYLSNLPAKGFKMPYWWHDGIDAAPPLDFINKDLRDYIQNGLKGCINNFEPFADRFAIKELKEPVAEVKFNDNDVYVSLKYPIEIAAKYGDFKALRETFAYTAPVRFKKIYELAKLIMERENKDYFLEQKTIDLYSMDKEIPTTDIEAGCGAKVWQIKNIKDKLQDLLRVNLPYIRIQGTEWNKNLYVPEPNSNTYSNSYYQQHYIWEIDKAPGAKYSNMKVSFVYDDWPIDVYARPSENGVLKSNSQKGAKALSFFCLHIWHFTYDINYPVVVSILDQEGESNKQYQFNFAFKVSIEHNQPNRISTGTSLFEPLGGVSSEEYCNDVQNEITVFTVNNANGDDMPDVDMTFVCGRFYCDMEKSEWLDGGGSAGIRKKFPFCFNGIIKGMKEGFVDTQEFLQTDRYGNTKELFLNPIKTFKNFKIIKHSLSNPAIAEELEPDKSVSIIIKGKGIEFESFALYPKEDSSPLTILDGKDAAYEVSIYLTDNENDNILGGYVGEWKVSKNDLNSADEATFHIIALEQEHPSEDDMSAFASKLSEHSKLVPAPEVE